MEGAEREKKNVAVEVTVAEMEKTEERMKKWKEEWGLKKMTYLQVPLGFLLLRFTVAFYCDCEFGSFWPQKN